MKQVKASAPHMAAMFVSVDSDAKKIFCLASCPKVINQIKSVDSPNKDYLVLIVLVIKSYISLICPKVVRIMNPFV